MDLTQDDCYHFLLALDCVDLYRLGDTILGLVYICYQDLLFLLTLVPDLLLFFFMDWIHTQMV